MQHQLSETPPEATISGAPPIGRLYDVGERRLFLHHSGSGGPAVVFLPGAGMVGLDYLNVHDRASKLAMSVLYDRAGTGWSDRVTLPRTAAEVADELRSLLHAVGVPAPYLLVGHSLGGLYVRRYAQRFPDEVAGLLLLDPGHEDYPSHTPEQLLAMQEQMTMEQALPGLGEGQLQYFRGLIERMFAEWPDSIRYPLVERHLDPEWWRHIAGQERRNLSELYDELRHGGDIPDVPLIVLSAMGLDPFQVALMPEHLLHDMNDGKRLLYTALAASVPRGEHRLLEDAGHSTIHTDRPDAVFQAIRDLLMGNEGA